MNIGTHNLIRQIQGDNMREIFREGENRILAESVSDIRPPNSLLDQAQVTRENILNAKQKLLENDVLREELKKYYRDNNKYGCLVTLNEMLTETEPMLRRIEDRERDLRHAEMDNEAAARAIAGEQENMGFLPQENMGIPQAPGIPHAPGIRARNIFNCFGLCNIIGMKTKLFLLFLIILIIVSTGFVIYTVIENKRIDRKNKKNKKK